MITAPRELRASLPAELRGLRRDGARIEGRQPCLQITHMFERRIPPRLQFTGDQPHVGIHAFVTAAGELGVVAAGRGAGR